MSIRCGNHGWNGHVYHASAAEVRECFGAQQQPTIWPEDPTVALNASARTRTYDPAADSRSDSGVTDIKLDHVWEGAYAIEDPADGRLRFLEVDKPKDGQWQHWTFVKVRASDELHKLGSVNPRYGTYKGKAPTLVRALAALDKAGLQQAAIRFGLEIGECGFCRRSLTDDEGDVNSRTLGYGPVCAGRHGLYHPKARAS